MLYIVYCIQKHHLGSGIWFDLKVLCVIFYELKHKYLYTQYTVLIGNVCTAPCKVKQVFRLRGFVLQSCYCTNIPNLSPISLLHLSSTYLWKKFFKLALRYDMHDMQMSSLTVNSMHTQPDSHYIRYTAASVLKSTTLRTPEGHWLTCAW